MEYKSHLILSPTRLQYHKQLKGAEAVAALAQMGLTFIHIDDDGAIRALNKKNQYLENYYLYEKKVPILA